MGGAIETWKVAGESCKVNQSPSLAAVSNAVAGIVRRLFRYHRLTRPGNCREQSSWLALKIRHNPGKMARLKPPPSGSIMSYKMHASAFSCISSLPASLVNLETNSKCTSASASESRFTKSSTWPHFGHAAALAEIRSRQVGQEMKLPMESPLARAAGCHRSGIEPAAAGKTTVGVSEMGIATTVSALQCGQFTVCPRVRKPSRPVSWNVCKSNSKAPPQIPH